MIGDPEIGELKLTLIDGKFTVTGATERGAEATTAAAFVDAVVELVGKPDAFAAAFGTDTAALAAALRARKQAARERPIIVNTPKPDGIN